MIVPRKDIDIGIAHWKASNIDPSRLKVAENGPGHVMYLQAHILDPLSEILSIHKENKMEDYLVPDRFSIGRSHLLQVNKHIWYNQIVDAKTGKTFDFKHGS